MAEESKPQSFGVLVRTRALADWASTKQRVFWGLLTLVCGPLIGYLVGLRVSGPAFLAAAGGLLLAGLLVFAWHLFRASGKIHAEQEAEMASLREALLAVNNVYATAKIVEAEGGVFLEVQNLGLAARFSAQLMVDGLVAERPSGDVFACWQHTESVDTVIPTQRINRLILGQREAWGGVGHWFIPYTRDGKAGKMAAHYSFLPGQAAPPSGPVTVTVALFAEPGLAGGPILKSVRLWDSVQEIMP